TLPRLLGADGLPHCARTLVRPLFGPPETSSNLAGRPSSGLQKATARRASQKRRATAGAQPSEHGWRPPFDAPEHRGALPGVTARDNTWEIMKCVSSLCARNIFVSHPLRSK